MCPKIFITILATSESHTHLFHVSGAMEQFWVLGSFPFIAPPYITYKP